MPIYTPIFSFGILSERIAYGIDNILPHEIPIKAKHHFKLYDDSGESKSIQINPIPPAANDKE